MGAKRAAISRSSAAPEYEPFAPATLATARTGIKVSRAALVQIKRQMISKAPVGCRKTIARISSRAPAPAKRRRADSPSCAPHRRPPRLGDLFGGGGEGDSRPGVEARRQLI